ncbi:MerR family transcriptional regulator [Actinomycetota bacterium Odt1-20B]
MAPRPDPTEAGAALTTGAVARRLGVAATTLRSWQSRYGIGPTARHSGAHRHWTAADLAVLEHMRRLTNSGVSPAEAARTALTSAPAPGRPRTGTAHADAHDHAAGPPPPPLPETLRRRRGLSRAATRLDAPAIQDLVSAAIGDYGVIGAWNDVLMPTLHAVGRKWETEGEPYVEVEHLLSWHVSSSLRRVVLDASARRPDSGVALLACVPGEEHTLALECLAAVMAQRALALRMFGAAVPPQALAEAVRRTGSMAIILWSQCRSTAAKHLAAQLASMEWGVRGARTRPTVLLAGPGWSGIRIPGTRHPLGLVEAADAMEELLTAPLATAGR